MEAMGSSSAFCFVATTVVFVAARKAMSKSGKSKSTSKKSKSKRKLLPNGGHMNLILIDADADGEYITDLSRDKEGKTTALEVLLPSEDDRMNHIRSKLHKSQDAYVRVGLLNGYMGEAKILPGFALQCSFKTPPPKKTNIHLVVGLCRPPAFYSTIISAVCLGVREITIVNFERVEKTLWSSHLVKYESVVECCKLGLGQARDTVMPKIVIKRTGGFPFELLHGGTTFFCHPANDDQGRTQEIKQESLGNVAKSDAIIRGIDTLKLNIIIGPEGGFIQREVDAFQARGCYRLDLGKRILKVEHATIVAIMTFLAHGD